MSIQILAHFDPKLSIILATDSSDGGVGAVISHRYSDNTERPIAYASMTLNKSERNYSQVEKDALAIIFGVKKFYNYLAGRKFEIISDHKPLTTIFNPSKSLPVYALNRLQRWAMILMSFNYTIKYKSTAEHCNADCLSRLPAGNDEEFKDLDSIEIAAIHTMIWDKVPVSATKVAECTKKDGIFNRVMDYIKSEWRGKIHPEIEIYYKIRDQLSIQNDIILRDTQVVIPAELRKQILETLHAAHVGSVRMKKTAREYCWWPNINNDIARLAASCKICVSHAPNPTPEYEPWPEPKSVWSRVHMDFADLWDGKWLIVIDAKSKFPFAIPMGNNTTASSLIDSIDQIFGLFGFPELIVTDNGPPFQSKEVLKYYEAYGIRSLTIAPYHPASNGIAERSVRSFKDSMKKMREEGYEKMYAVRTFLRQMRWTTHSITEKIPAEEFLGRELRSTLGLLRPYNCCINNSKFCCNEQVLTKGAPTEKSWSPAKIIKPIGTNMYEVQLSSGELRRRHVNQLRPNTSPSTNESTATEEDIELEGSFETDEQEEIPENNMVRAPQQVAPPIAHTPQRVAVRQPAVQYSQPRRTQRNIKPPNRYSPGVGQVRRCNPM